MRDFQKNKHIKKFQRIFQTISFQTRVCLSRFSKTSKKPVSKNFFVIWCWILMLSYLVGFLKNWPCKFDIFFALIISKLPRRDLREKDAIFQWKIMIIFRIWILVFLEIIKFALHFDSICFKDFFWEKLETTVYWNHETLQYVNHNETNIKYFQEFTISPLKFFKNLPIVINVSFSSFTKGKPNLTLILSDKKLDFCERKLLFRIINHYFFKVWWSNKKSN